MIETGSNRRFAIRCTRRCDISSARYACAVRFVGGADALSGGHRRDGSVRARHPRRAARPSASGSSSIRPSIPPAVRRGPRIWRSRTRFPTFAAGRGGQWTYHGPGQRVGYVMLDLDRPHGSVPARDLRAYVHGLEEWLIRTLDRFNIRGERRAGRVGIWVADRAAGTEAKIAAIGVRVTRWVSWHGIAHQPRSATRPLRGHCSLRHPRVWGDKPPCARDNRDHGRAGCRAGGQLGRGFRRALEQGLTRRLGGRSCRAARYGWV